MFPKPAFGGTSSGFGSFNSSTTAASPFGGFKPASTGSAFGAPPAFGANAAPQPTTGGGLFGASNTSSGLFGATTAAPAPAFGATGGFGFGATPSAGGGLFSNTSTGLFGGGQNTSAFGAKPPAFGFSNTTAPATSGGLFAAQPTQQSGLFAQQPTAMGGGLFSNTTGAFGQQAAAPGTGHAKYNPVVGTDVVVKAGASQNINIKHHCISCMKEYENKSLEELRLEDYTAGRKGGGSGVFGGFAKQEPLFGGSTFAQPATTTASTVFGGGISSGGGFGQTNTFSFGSNAQNATNTTGLFGAAKPAFGAPSTTGTGLFGATTTQAPTFGTTSTPAFGFGSTTPNQQGGLFGAKPATTGFGAAPTTGGFGGFGAGGGLFAAKPQQSAAPAFGTATPAFGSLAGGFGTNTSASSGGLFGANTFGKTATAQPTFGFNAPTTGLGTGLGAGLGSSFQAKPAGPAFGAMGGGSLFNTPAQTHFSSGLDSGLGGGGLFSNSGLGGSSLGMGAMGAGNALNSSLAGASAAGNVHEQILTLVARPYGDSPLFKDLLPDSSTTAQDVLKPTNPAAMKAVLDSFSSGNYRVTSPTIRLKVQPRAPALTHDKKSLFDGLEESDASLEDKLSLKPSRKRLVLRPKGEEHNDSVDHHAQNRSQEDARESNGTSPKDKQTDTHNVSGEHRFRREAPSLEENNNLEKSSDRHGSWLNASKHQWSAEKEKPVLGEATPRLYPNLEKELPIQIERRASWLTTKPLRKPLGAPVEAETSVRELGLRQDQDEHDKENQDSPSVTEEEHVAPRELPPHPTGVKLTRPGYYTIPSLDEMIKYMRQDGSCVVPHLTIGRKNYGNVFYDCEIDVAGMDLDALVHFMNKEITVYPDDGEKPPVGSGLNRRAIVTLDRVWPRDKTDKRPITDPDRLMAMDYEGKLRRVCDKHDTKFVEYRPMTGSWVFRVEHFSKYTLTDSDEEDDPTPEVMKRQLVNQQLQKAAPPAPPKPPVAVTSPGLGGLGGLGGPSFAMPQAPYSGPGLAEDSLFAMHQTSLNLLTGAGKAFEMDTTEDNTETPSLYQDSHRAYGVKSPTSELARLEHRQSHHVQLMKASLYADADMEDDASVSTGDQQVPLSAPLLPAPPPVQAQYEHDKFAQDADTPPPSEEIPMKPLLVQPHTIVLKYHRKIPPFKQTIAGRLFASCMADMAVCRARHSRVGFGPGGKLAYATSYHAISQLPPAAELSELGEYVRGRREDDWSEQMVARIALGHNDPASPLQEILTRHLETLLEHSSASEASEDACPRQSLRVEPAERLAALLGLLKDYGTPPKGKARFGVSAAYCYEVFKLCEALWGADLENDGVPGTDEQSIVGRHRRLLHWLVDAVASSTDAELAQGRPSEPEDESDSHSARVWTLLLGGRVLEACRVARDHGDLNMATLIAQAAGDPSFRSLISRQLSLWRECGADSLISSYRMATLQLIAGASSPRDKLAEADWLRALHATARYLCPQVPSLEQVVRTYESLFSEGAEGEGVEDEGVDLATADLSELGMKCPLPPYAQDYDSVSSDNKRRRVLDLRYELVRARAMNSRPKLQPAAYTPDPMDYTLCFLLGVWFGGPSAEACSGVAAQLEAAGQWHLAAQALAYHPDESARGHLIRGVISRHAPASPDGAQKSQLRLLQRLGVPHKWVLTAQAHRARYEHLPRLEAAHLAGAGQWNLAHAVLLDQLLPDAVLADDLQSIAPLLEQLHSAAQRHEVSGWDSGGQALHHYLHVCDEIRGLVSAAEADRDRSSAQTRLAALRPRVASACLALGRLPSPSPRHAAARTEMGARLVQLALAAGEPAQHLARLLRALKIPPDCTAAAQYKITTDLAEQASHLCIESASSSPLSSHHRAVLS